MITIRTKGVAKNILLLNGYPVAVRKELSEAAKNAMGEVFEKSQQLVPVLTGELKESGEVFQTATGAGVRYSAPHAKRIEYDASLHHTNGTAFFVGKPFREKKKEIKAELKTAAMKPLK